MREHQFLLSQMFTLMCVLYLAAGCVVVVWVSVPCHICCVCVLRFVEYTFYLPASEMLEN